MRALEPRTSGYAINPDDGVRSYFELFGPAEADHSLLFLPTWSLVHSRCWKMQVPYFARRGFQVITFDGRGNGKSDRPKCGYTAAHYAADALAVLDMAGVERVALVTLSAGSRPGAQLAAEQPERVSHFILIAPAIRLSGGARLSLDPFLNEPPDREGWNKYNAVHWREAYPDFVAWFTNQIFSEPHSTKAYDDFVAWALETTPEVLIATTIESETPEIARYCASIQCPALIVHGTDDRITPIENSHEIRALIPGCELFAIEGGGHAPTVRDPVRTNLVLHEFFDRGRAAHQSEAVIHARA